MGEQACGAATGSRRVGDAAGREEVRGLGFAEQGAASLEGSHDLGKCSGVGYVLLLYCALMNSLLMSSLLYSARQLGGGSPAAVIVEPHCDNAVAR